MNIHHIAIWTNDIECIRSFYVTYFGCTHGDKYINPAKGFESYFLRFENSASIEIMWNARVAGRMGERSDAAPGFTHLAISIGSKEEVDTLTERLRGDGYAVVGEPRTTGDGYYEAVVLDPEGNRIELVG
jgi:lactoylglutathione lyase